MSYYGERDSYYGAPPQPTYDRPPYERPPYSNPPYDRPPQDSPAYDRPPYDRPPYERPPPERSFDPSRPRYEGPPYNTSPPAPSARPPPVPPPPLPLGWIQEWEPSLRRAYFVETATGRSQWESPMADAEYARGGGPPESAGYYACPPPPPPQDGGYYPPPEEKKKSSGMGKIIAGGVAGVALGAAGMALWEHEKREFFFFCVAAVSSVREGLLTDLV